MGADDSQPYKSGGGGCICSPLDGEEKQAVKRLGYARLFQKSEAER